MATYRSPTTLICSNLAVGWQTGFDLTIDINPIAESAAMERTWNGRLVNLADDAFKLFEVRISSGEGDMRPPALDEMWPGKVFSLVPPVGCEHSSRIAQGGTTRTLIRDPHPGSVRCLDLGFVDIPFTVSGRVVTLDAPAETPVRIYYRPVFELMVYAPYSKSQRETRAEAAWSIQAQEVGGEL